jgi:hypothetical protein
MFHSSTPTLCKLSSGKHNFVNNINSKTNKGNNIHLHASPTLALPELITEVIILI